MDLKSKIKNWLNYLRELPDQQKKIILWTIVAILGLIMAFFWIRGAANNLSKIGENVNNIEFPQIEIPTNE